MFTYSFSLSAREWTLKSGTKINGDYNREQDQYVVIKRDSGKLAKIKFTSLIDRDQKYINTLKQSKQVKSPPKLPTPSKASSESNINKILNALDSQADTTGMTRTQVLDSQLKLKKLVDNAFLNQVIKLNVKVKRVKASPYKGLYGITVSKQEKCPYMLSSKSRLKVLYTSTLYIKMSKEQADKIKIDDSFNYVTRLTPSKHSSILLYIRLNHSTEILLASIQSGAYKCKIGSQVFNSETKVVEKPKIIPKTIAGISTAYHVRYTAADMKQIKTMGHKFTSSEIKTILAEHKAFMAAANVKTLYNHQKSDDKLAIQAFIFNNVKVYDIVYDPSRGFLRIKAKGLNGQGKDAFITTVVKARKSSKGFITDWRSTHVDHKSVDF